MSNQRADFAEFYHRSRNDCLRAVLVNVGDQDAAQDLVAEAFARAWASWPTVRYPAPAAWVVRTALNAGVQIAAGRLEHPKQGGIAIGLEIGLVQASQACTGS